MGNGQRVRLAVVGGMAGLVIGALGLAEAMKAHPDLGTAWRTHAEPSGFAAEVPRAWAVATDAGARRIEVAGQHGEKLLVWRVATPELSGGAESARAFLALAAGRLWPGADFEAVEADGPDSYRAAGATRFLRGSVRLTRLDTARGDEWLVAVATAPPNRSLVSEYRFDHVIASLRLPGTLALASAVASRNTDGPGGASVALIARP